MITDRTYEEAANWLVRQEDDDAMDWNGFTLWLEADPAHRAAYDLLAVLDRQLDDHREPLAALTENSISEPANEPHGLPWGKFLGFGGSAVAASVAAFFLLHPVQHRPDVRDYRSPSNQSLQVALGGGVHVLLAPASSLRLEGTQISLLGDGYFDVPHKEGRVLTVTAGTFQVSDIGTRFSVESDPERVSIEVAQGTLQVSSAQLRTPISLSAGHGMSAASADGSVRLFSIGAQEVASWRAGKLEFDGAPLALVAREISRYSGKPTTVDPRIANQPFSGVIAIHEGEEPARTLAQILSLDVRSVDGAMRLEPRRK